LFLDPDRLQLIEPDHVPASAGRLHCWQTFRKKGVHKMKTLLRSQDLSCPSCVAKIEKALQELEGVTSAKVHFNTGRIEVEHDPEKALPAELVQIVRATGYEAKVAAF
jgi:copper chaperone